MKKITAIAASVLLAVALFSGCAETDIVARLGKSSFAEIVNASGTRAYWNAEEGAWALASPLGDEVLIASDFSRNNAAGKPADLDMPDIELSVDAAPFLAAGLDPERLPKAENYLYEIEDGRLMLHFELGDAKFSGDAAKSFAIAFAELVRTDRKALGYHAALDHYGLALGGGNMFEWAKDLSKNDKDIVWALDPAALAAAGLDPERVEGWKFAEVEVMNAAGEKVLVEKLLRPFDLR